MRTVKCVLALMLVVLLGSGCGLLTPREVEPPDPSVQRKVDPFSFADILASKPSTNDYFRLLDYDDLFHEDFVYWGIEDDISFTKSDMLTHLNTLENLYDSINVTWALADSGEPDLNRSSTVTLNTRTYSVYASDGQTEVSQSGETIFKLVYNDSKEAWTILYWRDIPASGISRSIFHPQFQP